MACPEWPGGAPTHRCSSRWREGGRGDQTRGTRHDFRSSPPRPLGLCDRAAARHRSQRQSGPTSLKDWSRRPTRSDAARRDRRTLRALFARASCRLSWPHRGTPVARDQGARFRRRLQRRARLRSRSSAARTSGFELRFETPPGEQAQVDFARFEVEFVDEPGVKRIVWLFSMVLGYSRLIWARFVLHQDLQASCAVISPPWRRSAARRARSSTIA